MNRKNIGKVLGIVGVVIVGKSQFSAVLNNPPQQSKDIQVISIQSKDSSSLTEKAFDFVGTPQLRISSISSSSTIAGIGIYLTPSVVDVDFS